MHLFLIMLLACASNVYAQRIAEYSANTQESAKSVILRQSAGCIDKQSGAHNPEYQYQYDPRDDRAYRKYLWATIIGVVGGVIGIFILIYQSILTRQSVRTSYKSSEAVMDSEMAVLWISDREVALIWEGSKIHATFDIHNIGRTSAVVFAGDHLLQMSDDESKPPMPQMYDLTDEFSATSTECYFPPDANLPKRNIGVSDCIALLSTISDPVIGRRSEDNPFKIVHITSADWTAISTGKKILWCYGFTRYRDIFKRRFELRFCFRYRHNLAPSPGFVSGGPDEFNRLSALPIITQIPMWRRALRWYTAQIELMKNATKYDH